MIRHGRAHIRHQRERFIKNRKKKLEQAWNWTPEHTGQLSKFSAHHHACPLCSSKYKRNKPTNYSSKPI